MAGKREKIQDEFLKMHEDAGGTYSGADAEVSQQAVNTLRDTAQKRYQSELSSRIAQKQQKAREQGASTGRTFARFNSIIGGQGIDLAKQAADNVAPYLREATLAQKAYDDYVKSPEYRKKQENIIAENFSASESPISLPQLEDDRAKELKAKRDYYKNLSVKEDDRRTLERNLAQIDPKDEEAFILYTKLQDGDAAVSADRDVATFYDFGQMKEVAAPLEAKYGKDNFKRLAEAYGRYYRSKKAEELTAQAQKDVETVPGAILGSATSVATNAFGGLGATASRIRELFTRTGQFHTLDPYTAGDMAQVYGGGLRGAVAENIAGDKNNKVRAGLSKVYEAGMSAADSVARAAAFGSGSLALVAASSFSSTLSEASQKGATPEQAYLMATANAGLEVLTEKVSLDSLLDVAKAKGGSNLRKVLLNTFGQAGVEISEEEASYIGGLIAEAAILQGKSEYNQTIGELVANGMSYEEAKAQANKDVWNEAVNTAVVSGLSGGISGGVATGYNAVMNRLSNPGGAATDTQEAAGGQQAGVLPETSMDTAKAQSPGVEAAGEPQVDTVPTNALSDAIDTLKQTGNVSNKTVEKVLADPAAVQQLKEAGTDLSQLATASEKRNAVKAAVRQMAGDTAPTALTREGAQSLIEDMGQELAERAPARQETPEVSPKRQAVQNAIDQVLGVDTGTDGNYNAINGNPIQGGIENAGTAEQGTAQRAGNQLYGASGEGVQQVQGSESGNPGLQGGRDLGQGDIRDPGELLLSETAQKALSEKGSPQVADSSGQSTDGGQADATAKSSVGAADRDFTGFEAYDNLLSDDNVQPRRASDAKNVEVPKTDTYGRDVSEFAHNAMNSDIISSRDIDTAKRLVQEGAFGHDTQKMADVRDRVYDEIQEKGVSASVREVSRAAAGGKISEYDIAKAQVLFAMLTDKKGVRAENMAGELLVDLGEMATQSGRQLNMFKLLRKLTPEGQISAVKSNINRYVDTLNEHRSAKKQVNVEIPAELEQDYVKAVRSGNEATQKQALDQMYEYAAAQIPATLEEKFNSLRHLSMLGAPLTHIRNFGATGAFRPMSDIKRTISAGIQAVALDQKNRTAAVIGLGKESRELLSWAKNDAKSDMAVSMMKGTYQNGDNARSEIESKRTIFKNKALEGYRKLNSNALEAEDMVWKKQEYALTLASFLKARGYTVDQVTGGAVPSEVMAEGRELAVKESLKSTFNDRNKFSDAISKFRKKGSDPWSRSLDIMAQGILPYTRTPANLGVRAVEYSPAGLAKAAYDLTEGVKSGKITAAQGIDNLASGLTGTGMMFLGGALAAGIIPGVRLVGAKPDDDEDEENTQEYALEIGDLSISTAWLAPVNIPLFIGANLYNKIKAAGDDGDVDPWNVMTAIVDSTTSILDPVLELSCMSGLNDAIDNMKYEDTAGDKFVAMAYSAATGYFLQAIPTLFGRIEKGVEPNKKRTFSNGETTVQRSVERTLGGAFQKLPGDPFQIDKVDAYGNVVKDSSNPVTRLANALLNPFNVQKIDRSELTQEIKRLSGVQPDKVNMPSAPKTVSYTDADGNHHDNERLTAEQYSTLEKTQKQTAAKLLNQVIGTDIYKAMTDDQKADVFSYVYNYAREKGRAEAIDGYPGLSDSWMQDVNKSGYGAIVEKVVTKSFSNAFTSMEEEKLDQAYGLYQSLPFSQRENFKRDNSGRVGYYITAKEKGVSDGVFTDLYGTYKGLGDDKSMTANQKAQEWSKTLAGAYEDGKITKAAHDALKEEMGFRQTYTAKTEKFDAMTESGLSSDVADRIIKGLADLQGTGSVDKDTGEATVTNRDKWGYIAALDGLSDKEKDRVMLLYMPDYNPDSQKPDKTELKYAYLRGRGYSAEQFTQTYSVTQEFTKKADMIAAWVALGYSSEEAQMFYKLYKGKIV